MFGTSTRRDLRIILTLFDKLSALSKDVNDEKKHPPPFRVGVTSIV